MYTLSVSCIWGICSSVSALCKPKAGIIVNKTEVFSATFNVDILYVEIRLFIWYIKHTDGSSFYYKELKNL